MVPKERLPAGDCLRIIETGLLNNHILDNGVITQTRKTALPYEVADNNDATTAISRVLRVQKASNFGGNCSPIRVSKILIQKMVLQDKVARSTGPTTSITEVFRGQQPQIREILAILVVSLKGNCRKRIYRMKFLIAMAPLISQRGLIEIIRSQILKVMAVQVVSRKGNWRKHLQDEVIDCNVRYQKTSNPEDSGSPGCFSERQL